MPDLRNLVHPSEALVILGSLNAHPEDRNLERSEVRPVQVAFPDGVHPAPFFDPFGDFGVSSLAWHPRRPDVLYLVADSDAEAEVGLWKVDLREQRAVELRVPNLRDVHEITVVGDVLWLSNTGLDEAVAFDLLREQVSERVSLSVQGSTPKVTVRASKGSEDEREVTDKFHCNQVFEGLDGDLYALVHYAVGKQLLRRATQKLIKRQGNGGVVNLTTGRATPLGLKQPHSVRKVGGGYWVLDSGRSTINVYAPDWTLQGRFSSKGWGRGADVSGSLGLFYTGVSEIRKRYLDLVPDAQRAPNMVQPISIETRAPVGQIMLSGLEQVNDVRVVPRKMALALLGLRASSAGG